jgi:hypothetical protein
LPEPEKQKVDAYEPHSNLVHLLNRGGRLQAGAKHPLHPRMLQRLRAPVERAVYGRLKAPIERIVGVLKEQRGRRQFRRRGWEKVAAELSPATTAYNLTRLLNTPQAVRQFG